MGLFAASWTTSAVFPKAIWKRFFSQDQSRLNEVFMKLNIKKALRGQDGSEKRARSGTFELFAANVDNCFYNNDIYCVYLYLRNTCWLERNHTYRNVALFPLDQYRNKDICLTVHRPTDV